MTYLELVNRVLRGLRENTVTALSEDYPRLVGQLVNEAKSDLEDSGPWSSLRSQITATLASGLNDKRLTDTNERSYLNFDENNQPLAFVVEAGFERRLQLIMHPEMVAMRLLTPDADSGAPCYISFTRDNDNMLAHFFPAADQDYDFTVVCTVPQADLSSETDEITVPADPVWRDALVRAMEERGEEFAGQIEGARSRAADARSRAVMRDFGASPLTFEAI